MFHQIFCVLYLLIYQELNNTWPLCVASQKKKKKEIDFIPSELVKKLI